MTKENDSNHISVNRMFVLREEGKKLVADLVDIDDIEYCSYEDHKIMVHTPEASYIFPHNLEHFEYVEGFFKTDRSFVVNWKNVKAYDKKWSQLTFKKSDKKVNVAQKYKRALRTYINKLLRV